MTSLAPTVEERNPRPRPRTAGPDEWSNRAPALLAGGRLGCGAAGLELNAGYFLAGS